jgi:hypothetical protein
MFNRSDKRRMIGKAKVAAKPEDRRHTTHRTIIASCLSSRSEIFRPINIGRRHTERVEPREDARVEWCSVQRGCEIAKARERRAFRCLAEASQIDGEREWLAIGNDECGVRSRHESE